jgi:hypothetical protein
MNDNNNDEEIEMDAEEFADKLAEIDNEPEAPEQDQSKLLDFSELLNLNEDINDMNGRLDEAAGHWAEIVIVLEDQVEAAETEGKSEKADALRRTLEKAEEAATRIDGGDTLTGLRMEIREQDE